MTCVSLESGICLNSQSGIVVPTVQACEACTLFAARQPQTQFIDGEQLIEPVGTVLHEMILRIAPVRRRRDCGCEALANDMDAWGVDGCRLRRDHIVSRMLQNRGILVDGLREGGKWWQAQFATLMPDAALHAGAHWLLGRAIDDVNERYRMKATQRAKQTREGVKPLTAEQIAKYYDATRPPVPDPFDAVPVLHFGAHLWPVRGHWRWHVERWNELAKTINGKLIVGVVTDDTTDAFDDVVAALDSRFECFEARNTGSGESPTFARLLTMIPSGQNDVLLYCHGKGVREHTAASESVRLWTEMMYEAVPFNHARIVAKLADGFKCFGAFRTLGDEPSFTKNTWHYSGTFFAVRAKHIADKPVHDVYGGVEAWCGNHFEAVEAWCEFYDAPGFRFGYDINAMYPHIVNAQMQWEADRIGGTRCEQHKRELDWFLEWLNPTDRVLVIGSKHGGLEAAIKRRLPDVQTLAIDIEPQVDNTQEVIVGSSRDLAVQSEARSRGPFDVVFIDGDHSYAGAQADYWFAQSLNPRLIALHDIGDTIKHRTEGCEVDRLWSDIKASGRQTEEKIVGCGWGGIGIVWRDRGHSTTEVIVTAAE